MAISANSHTNIWQYPLVAVAFYAALIHTGLGLSGGNYVGAPRCCSSCSAFAFRDVISHIIGIRLSQTLFETEKLYPQVLYSFWVNSPGRLWLMTAVLNVAWIHGCIGPYFWLRMKRCSNPQPRSCSPPR